MRCKDSWIPTKYYFKNGKLRASRDKRIVSPGSRLTAELVARFFHTNIPMYAHGRLADLGCGQAPLYETYKDQVDDIVCVDWPGGCALKHLDVACDLGKELPFADCSFDTIIISDVVEHLPNPSLVWNEMYRILADSGVVLLSTPFLYCLHEQPHDYYRFTHHALKRLAQTSGFNVISLVPAGGSPEVFADFLGKHLQFVPIIGPTLAGALQDFTFWCVNTAVGRILSSKTSVAFPIEYLLIARKATKPSGNL